MASKSAVQTEAEKAEVIEDALNDLEKEIDRLKSMYEQYFLGIQKTAPAFIHNEVDRKIRDLTQANIRQTRLRYKFVTLNQKFGSYNAYWRRTLREIESGKYIRNLQKIGREAVRSGDEIPQEILNAMPKRMREQVVRDREAAIAQAKRRGKLPGNEFAGEDSTQEDAEILALDGQPPDSDDFAAVIKEPTELRRHLKPAPNRPHQMTKEDADFDLDAFFKQVETEDEHTNVKGGIPQPAPSSTRISPAPPQPARITQPLASPKPASDPARPPPTPPARPSDPVVPPARVTSAQPPVRPSDPVLAPPPPAPPGVARIRPSVAMAAQKPPATPPPSPTTPVIPRNNQTQPGFQPAKAGLQTMPGVQPAKPAAPPRQPLVQPPPPLTTQPIPVQVQTAPLPRVPSVPGIARIAASQATKPLPVQPGATDSRPTPAVESVSSGQFKRPVPAPALKPPPGMSDADVNALHANYIKAKQMVGEDPGSGSRDKLLRTINAQAPKIMDQYKVGAVDFSVIVKDNQVIIRAKPKGKP